MKRDKRGRIVRKRKRKKSVWKKKYSKGGNFFPLLATVHEDPFSSRSLLHVGRKPLGPILIDQMSSESKTRVGPPDMSIPLATPPRSGSLHVAKRKKQLSADAREEA